MGTGQQPPQMMDAELQKMYEAIQQKRASINMQAQQSSTPLWDEIDKIEDNLTGAQRQYLMQNQEYVDSLQYVSKLVQDEELRIIRPRIESTQQGQEALKKHLSLMQRLRKEVAQAEEQKSAMLNDYMTNHSDNILSWFKEQRREAIRNELTKTERTSCSINRNMDRRKNR